MRLMTKLRRFGACPLILKLNQTESIAPSLYFFLIVLPSI